MAEPSPYDQLALHEFSVRYRAALAKQHPLSELHFETIQDAIRSEYAREQSQPTQGISLDSPTTITQPEPEPDEPEI